MLLVVQKFAPLQSRIDASFWSELSERKLDKYQLSEEPVAVHGSWGPSRYEGLGSQLLLDGNSFEAQPESRPGCHMVPGAVINLNTLDSFNSYDKTALLKKFAQDIWSDIISGHAEHHPAVLSRFLILCHADLKQFHFHYWFALPALKPPKPFMATPADTLLLSFGEAAALQVVKACNEWLRPPLLQHQQCPQPILSDPIHGGLTLDHSVPSLEGAGPDPPSSSGPDPFWIVLPEQRGEAMDGAAWEGGACCVPLSSWQQHIRSDCLASQEYPCFLLATSDPSGVAGYPGWPLRNLLLLASVRMKLKSVKVLCIRESKTGRVDASRSLITTVQLPEMSETSGDIQQAPDAVGWEANEDCRLAPRKIDLSPLMNPKLLAEQAVGLNLRLMKWRAVPDLEIGKVAASRCLLLGAGTLGCAVARCLLAWGVRTVTFLDSSRVAYSNPVRQWLYELEDCTNGGKPKSQAAADALKRIFPSVEAQGRSLEVPMPGHAPANVEHERSMHQAYEDLVQQVQSHDVIFLLTDTRESRWLPALLAAAYGKVAITAALGFDSFVVMRHGGPPPGVLEQLTNSSSSQPRLGCYFCNDVVGPLNSTNNRTLDQQCTVARPGLAPIASALAVELVAALLQHPQGVHAPASGTGSASAIGEDSFQEEAVLGPVPHMIRGQLSGFNQVCMVGHASSRCTACSEAVLKQYREQGWSFILEALKDPYVLERVSGLDELHKGMDDLLAEVSSEDDLVGQINDCADPLHHDAHEDNDEEDEEWSQI